MAIEKREQVFISSTFKDLVEERRAAIQTLLEADCIPAGMELFPASDTEKWDLIRGVIDLCDYYVVIVGGRYGSMDDVEQLSYTEMEFDYAVKTKKPVMGFLHGDPGKLPGNKLDLDGELREKLDAFRAKIEKKMVKYWHEPGDLPGQVALAIMQIRKSHPAVGWIRASEAMTPAVKAELAELRAKVRELSADLHDEQRQNASVVDSSDLVQGEEGAPLECNIEFHWKRTFDARKAYKHNRSHGLWTVNPTWNDILKHLGPELMDEASEEYLRERLSALCDRLARNDLIKNDDNDDNDTGEATVGDEASADKSGDDEAEEDDRVGRIYAVEVTIESFNDVKVQFAALGLVEKGTKRRPGSDTNTYWCLTDRGQKQLLRLRAIREAVLVETEREAVEGDPATK
ncbi:hypothetical protein CGLY_14350 [Corynebacterium glyciniphilum AJ 3170]|uniref:DUF4062 domain-containing protein n=1 Tax=Corynebacterium glyciniphilum AJ 3170 TaxID=1404245 RepID=X5EFF4_9CORY|nr:DUF4062 domain-containing protein [Corynebacterium glyciniphilum]AHW65306.1 hypothetical protein CGLY_14350 [Corynebacterium glyciniphilum AJ 3170]